MSSTVGPPALLGGQHPVQTSRPVGMLVMVALTLPRSRRTARTSA